MTEYTFNDQETIDALQNDLNLIIREDNAPEAYLFAKKLESLLEDSNLSSDLSNKHLWKYKKMIKQAKFVSLYKQDEEEILDLINNHFNDIFNIKFYDISDKIDDFLSINKFIIKERDEFKEKLRKSLLDNKKKITKEEIKIGEEKVFSSINNWLRDFRDSFTEEGFKDSLNITKYISENKNFLALNKKEQKKVKTLFNLYAHLKILSSSPEGIEEHISIETEDGEPAIIVNGRIEKIPQAVIDIFNEVQRKTGGKLYHPPQKEISSGNQPAKKVFTPPETEVDDKKVKNISPKRDQKAINRLLESYKKFEMDLISLNANLKSLEKYKNNPDGILNKFNQDLEVENRDNLLADLIFICENKLLDKFFKDSKELLNEFKKDLRVKLSEDIINNIIEKSTSPETVSLYLQFLLFKKLNLSPKNSGLFGMHLANIFKKIGQEKYFPIVYGDLNLERFVWREVIEENGLVKFK